MRRRGWAVAHYQNRRENLNDDLGVATHRQGCERARGSMVVASTSSRCGAASGAGGRARTVDMLTAAIGVHEEIFLANHDLTTLRVLDPYGPLQIS
jgi:hypothetical protein